jgi:hypothetical protein
LRCFDRLAHAHDGDLKSRRSQSRHFGKFVGGLKRIEHGRQARVKDSIEREDMNLHGKYDINFGVFANG